MRWRRNSCVSKSHRCPDLYVWYDSVTNSLKVMPPDKGGKMRVLTKEEALKENPDVWAMAKAHPNTWRSLFAKK